MTPRVADASCTAILTRDGGYILGAIHDTELGDGEQRCGAPAVAYPLIQIGTLHSIGGRDLIRSPRCADCARMEGDAT